MKPLFIQLKQVKTNLTVNINVYSINAFFQHDQLGSLIRTSDGKEYHVESTNLEAEIDDLLNPAF